MKTVLPLLALALIPLGTAQLADPPAPDPPTREEKIAERITRRLATPDAKPPPPRSYDLDKLAEAVSRHETCGCTCGTGKSRLNCFGIMGKNGPLTFASKEESFAAFKALWLRRYGDALPDLRDATTYVCGPSHPTGKPCPPRGNPNSWLASVTKIYSSL